MRIPLCRPSTRSRRMDPPGVGKYGRASSGAFGVMVVEYGYPGRGLPI